MVYGLEPNLFLKDTIFYLLRGRVGTQKESLARSFRLVCSGSGIQEVSSELLQRYFPENILSLLAQTYAT